MIGVDPHKGSHTAVALDADERTLGQIRVRASSAQVENLHTWAASWTERVWGIENATGLGRLLAQQLLAAGEQVLDVQPKLAARVRLLNTATVNKDDPNDARSVAVAAMRSPDIRSVAAEDHATVMKVWVRRHRDLSRTRNRIVCRLHSVLCDLIAGGFPKQLSAIQAAAVLDGIEALDAVGEARLELAYDLLADLRRVDEQRRAVKHRLTKIVAASGTTVSEVYGGPGRDRNRHRRRRHDQPLVGVSLNLSHTEANSPRVIGLQLDHLTRPEVDSIGPLTTLQFELLFKARPVVTGRVTLTPVGSSRGLATLAGTCSAATAIMAVSGPGVTLPGHRRPSNTCSLQI
jgi:hypothetical protein